MFKVLEFISMSTNYRKFSKKLQILHVQFRKSGKWPKKINKDKMRFLRYNTSYFFDLTNRWGSFKKKKKLIDEDVGSKS